MIMNLSPVFFFIFLHLSCAYLVINKDETLMLAMKTPPPTTWSYFQKGFLDTKIAIDVGCGNGRSTKQLSRQYPDHLVFGIDKDPVKIRNAREKFPSLCFKNVDFMEADFFSPGSIDIIQMKDAVYMFDPNETSFQIYRLLKPNGLFILSEAEAYDMSILGEFYKSCMMNMMQPQRCILNDVKTEFIFQKSTI